MPFGDAAELEDLEAFVAEFASRLEPAERKKVGMRIANELRKSNAERQRAQVDAEGDAFVPRKKARSRRKRDKITGLKRRVKNRKMCLRAGGAGYLRKQSTTGEARVGYVGAMARIMAVHQEGQVDTVTRDPSSPKVKYPARRVLGISDGDRGRILELLIEQLDG